MLRSYLFTAWIFVLCGTIQGRHLRLTLGEAIERRLIKADGKALGGFQEECVSLTVQNLHRDSLVVVIEPGRRLASAADERQDILVVREEVLPLKGGEKRSVRIRGFCCEASDLAPPKDGRYSAGRMAAPGLVSVARMIASRKFDTGVTQSAIWAVSNGHSTGAIPKGDSSLQALRVLIAGIKGEELPWYEISTAQYLYPSGFISVVPLKLYGAIPYAAAETEYVTFCVLNEKGEFVGLMRSDWLPKSAQGKYEVDLPVKELSKGKYAIELRSKSGVVARKTFEI